MAYLSLAPLLLAQCALIFMPVLIMCENISDIENLRELLLSNYNRDIRPPRDHTLAIDINVTFRLVAIQDFDEVKGKFSVIGLLDVTWKDDRLEWIASSHGDIVSLPLKRKDVWVPELLLGNPYAMMDLGREIFPVRLFPDGTLFWSFGDVMKTFCDADLTYFPFDVQICYLQFVAWGRSYKELNLVSTLSEVPLGFYEGNGEWTITGTKANVSLLGGATVVTFYIEMERLPAFVIFNMAMPIGILGFVNPFVFALPASSGERVSYSVTILLSVSVYMSIVSDIMPTSSNRMAISIYCMLGQFILSSMMCIFSIYTMHIYDSANNNKPVPNYLKQSLCSRLQSSRSSSVEPISIKAQEIDMFKFSQSKTEPDGQSDTVNWDKVLGSVDRCFFIFFLVATILLNGIMIPVMYFQRHNKHL